MSINVSSHFKLMNFCIHYSKSTERCTTKKYIPDIHLNSTSYYREDDGKSLKMPSSVVIKK